MGADWYTCISFAVAGIPVPKEALQQPFDLPGFKLMTVLHEHYNVNSELENITVYHGAMICLANTELLPTSVEVIGPYNIEKHKASCKRMKYLDTFMPADTKDKLVSAFETYTGRKPDAVPGFWVVCATSEYLVDLYTSWSLGTYDSIVDGDSCDDICFTVEQDADGSDA
ncbi:hypothetical protein EC957_004929 [Mortierella hygrophila]|uniref:Uncharacterized protein n=1 Tax=Mortierella hygrophila TaxID=979708 RepID=A0A9P6F0Y6_9FUNG|nr:hypothetical protein EC957_004929 [Mortierella hygrophila]